MTVKQKEIYNLYLKYYDQSQIFTEEDGYRYGFLLCDDPNLHLTPEG